MVIIVAEKLVVNTETSKKRQRELVHLSQGWKNVFPTRRLQYNGECTLCTVYIVATCPAMDRFSDFSATRETAEILCTITV
jgi:hypothetical protein